MKASLIATDGADLWNDLERNRRVEELIGVRAEDLALMHIVRQLDFYADRGFRPRADLTWAPTSESPSAEECRRAVAIARDVLAAVERHVARGDP
jgi:hypothetical protein